MPDTAIDPIPKQGKFRRALAAVEDLCSGPGKLTQALGVVAAQTCPDDLDVILREHGELAVGHDFAAEGDDKGLAAEGVEIGRRGAEPGDELAMEVGRHTRSR